MSSVACLVVESDFRRSQQILESLRSSSSYEFECVQVASPNEAEDLMGRMDFELIVSQGLFPEESHSDVLSHYRLSRNDPVVLCLLEDEERSVILEAGKLGADDYVFYRDLCEEVLADAVGRAFERRDLIEGLRQMQLAPLNQGKGMYRALLHRLDSAVFLISQEDGSLVFQNKVAETWFPESTSGMVNQFFEYGILDSDSIELEIPTLCSAVPSAELRSVKLLWKGQDCVLVTLRNISKRKRAEAAYKSCQRRLDLALKASNIGQWSWDLERGRLHFSEKWKVQLGYESREFPDTLEAFRESIHAEDRKRVEGVWRRALDGSVRDFELTYRMRTNDGSYRILLCRAEVFPDESGQMTSLFGTHIDITDRETAPARRSLETSLSGKLGARMERIVADLEKSAAQIRANFRGDSAIAANIQELERLSRSFACLNEVVQLSDAATEEGVEPIELGAAVNELYRSQESLLPAKVELQVEATREIRIRGLSRRALLYALTEALVCVAEKVSADFKSCIRVSVCMEHTEEGDREIPCIHYFYTGSPVCEPEMHALSKTPHLVASSERVERTSRMTLRFEDRKDASSYSGGEAKLALLAEDEGVLRLAIRTMLESIGFEVVVARDGAEAIEAFARQGGEFDIALIDLQMPHIDGHGVVSSIRAVRSDLPIVRMSGDQNDKRGSGGDAVDFFLSKPFGIADLKSVINDLNYVAKV